MTIHGLKGREPIGAALSVGVKGPRGNPTRTDEFFLVSPTEGDNKIRPLLPQFAQFNEHPDAARRKMIRGNLVHSVRRECFEHHLRAMVEPGKPMHPDRRPWCTGDGERAERWVGPGPQDFRTITCPHERCEFRQRKANAMPACRPWMRLLFRLRWPDGNPLPTYTVKYTSAGWRTITGALGMFEALERAMSQMGAVNVPLYGYPIVLSLTMRTQPSQNRRYPVVDIVGETDPVEWVLLQKGRLAEIAAAPQIEALDSPEQVAAAAGDHALINPGPITVLGDS